MQESRDTSYSRKDREFLLLFRDVVQLIEITNIFIKYEINTTRDMIGLCVVKNMALRYMNGDKVGRQLERRRNYKDIQFLWMSFHIKLAA